MQKSRASSTRVWRAGSLGPRLPSRRPRGHGTRAASATPPRLHIYFYFSRHRPHAPRQSAPMRGRKNLKAAAMLCPVSLIFQNEGKTLRNISQFPQMCGFQVVCTHPGTSVPRY
eukprot:997371-Rhodomonas_salina.1